MKATLIKNWGINGKSLEPWERDIIKVLTYLARQAGFSGHIVWTSHSSYYDFENNIIHIEIPFTHRAGPPYDRVPVAKSSDRAKAELAHEIGHLEQFKDPNYRDKFERAAGYGTFLSPDVELDAYRRAGKWAKKWGVIFELLAPWRQMRRFWGR